MAFRFKLDETLEDGFRRIAASQIKQALSDLQAAEQNAQGVHSSRKTLKRLRALLRLVEPAIGSKQRRKLNAKLRDIGRALSEKRDDAVISETLERLRGEIPTSAKAFAAEPVIVTGVARDYVQARSVQGLSTTALDAESAARARQNLQVVSEEFLKAKFKKKGLAHIEAGLETSYRTGRAALRATYRNPEDEMFHDLRKAVQCHWRHMNLLSRAWPTYMEARLSAARELSQMLGDDQDLAMLIRSPVLDDDPQRDDLLALAIEQRARLQESALLHAERLFQEAPRIFARRIAKYWRIARRLGPISEPTDEVARNNSEKQIRKVRKSPIQEASAPKFMAKKPREAPSRKAG